MPLPTAAYWRDKAAGKKPRQTIFASSADPAIELISLDPTTPSDPVAEERLERARKAATASRRLMKPREPNTRTIDWSRINKPHRSVLLTAHTSGPRRQGNDAFLSRFVAGRGDIA